MLIGVAECLPELLSQDVGREINMLLETEKMAPESPDNRLSLHSVEWDGTFLDQFDN